MPARHVAGRAHADRQARRCRHLRAWPRPVDLGDAGSQAACLAALSAAESAEVACDGPGARAEGIARASGPGPPVDAPMCARDESRRLGRVPGSGRALVRRPLVEGAWVLARGNPAHRKRGGASVPLAIREHARACSGRLLGRRRGPVSRGLMPREANTATAAEMARMLPRVGRDAQEAAALAAEVARAA